jgi:hypothetical protein
MRLTRWTLAAIGAIAAVAIVAWVMWPRPIHGMLCDYQHDLSGQTSINWTPPPDWIEISGCYAVP